MAIGDEMRLLEELRIQLGANVRLARTGSGKTQRQLADLIGCELNYLQKIEYGRVSPSLALLVRLSVALDRPVAELFRHGGKVGRQGKGRPRKAVAKGGERKVRSLP